jgi:hypothetical protein
VTGLIRGAIPATDPDHLGRLAKKEAAFVKIGVLGHDGETLLGGVAPHEVVIGSGEAYVTNMGRVGIQGGERSDQAGREVLVE